MMNSLEIFSWFEHLYIVMVLVFVIGILASGKKSGSIMAWIFAVLFLPIVGIILYMVLGVNWRRRRILKNKLENSPHKMFVSLSNELAKNELSKYDTRDIFSSYKENVERTDKYMRDMEDHSDVAKLLYNTGSTYLTLNTSYDFYFDGGEAFDSIIKDLENAKESIYIEFFIWRSDELGERVKDVLIKKASEGLDIKLIFDGLGSFGRISRKYKKALEKAGIKYRYFLDIRYNILKLNYRNHRKMVIVDGNVLHTGGMNLGQEYIDGGKDFESWRDTNIRITGEMCVHYLAVFISDWLNSSGKFDFIVPEIEDSSSGDYLMQLCASGPDTIWSSLQMLYTKMITEAKEEILIESPYFVPDDSIFEQLKIAALSGIKVKIIMAGKPDKKIPFWVAETYFDEIIDSGMEIYRYQKGFLHCKNIIIDGKLATMGTCNFDFRSFELNYEINTVYYNKEMAGKLREQFFEDLKYCTEIKNEDLDKKGFLLRMRDSVFRVLSPIL